MALISQSEVEARLGRSLTAEESSAFTTINAALQAQIEKIIGSSVESVSASTRYYDGGEVNQSHGKQHLTIDPCTSVSAVKQVNDDEDVIQTYDTTDYTIEPRNRTLKNMIRHRVRFVSGINNIAVTAKFSIYEDTDTLNIIKNAMLEFLVSEVENSDNIKKESIEGYSIEYASTQAKDSLSKIYYLFPEI